MAMLMMLMLIRGKNEEMYYIKLMTMIQCQPVSPNDIVMGMWKIGPGVSEHPHVH